MRNRRTVVGSVLFAISVVLTSRAQTPPNIVLEQVTSGLSSPVVITNAGDGSKRLFIVEQAGRIRIHDVALFGTDFLNITSKVLCCGERGLLGLAFHPRYETNGLFYVFYTASPNGDLVVERYSRSAAPDIADAASGVAILRIAHPAGNHNGGQIEFGPDGYLYVAVGDGGGAGDTANNAQNTNNLLGKILRVDIDGAFPYAIPSTNPFFGSTTQRQEIWAYGLRNPWRFSFDRATRDLFIGDVGQGAREEIDHQSASPGGVNYGWRRMEGTLCFNPATACQDGSLVLPVFDYGRSLGFSVTGGYRYRGRRYPQMNGVYLFGDFGSGRIWGMLPNGGGSWTATELLDSPYSISTFGEDGRGEVYLAHFGGTIYRITAPPAFKGGDVTLDGNTDILWRNRATGETHIWTMDMTRYVSSRVLPTVPTSWTLAGGADFDGDGDVDLLWRNDTTRETHIWIMTGASYSRSVALVGPPTEWRIEATGDFNLDGKPDIVWRNYSTGQVHIHVMNGVSYSFSVALPPVPIAWQIEGAGDFDGDGKTDLIWRNYTTGENHIHILDGFTYVRSVPLPAVPDLNWRIEAVNDYNNDDDPDLVWRHYGVGANNIWLMNRTTFSVSIPLHSVGLQWQVSGPR